MHLENGCIIMEDNGVDGELFGFASALGDVQVLEEFAEVDVDTTVRPLDREASIAAVGGLYRMAEIDSTHSYTAARILERAGKNGPGLAKHIATAALALKQIALAYVGAPNAPIKRS